MASTTDSSRLHLIHRVIFKFEQAVTLPPSLDIGALIGRGGQAITQFRQRTRAFLKFLEGQPCVVVVCGHKAEHVRRGVELLQQQIEYFRAFGASALVSLTPWYAMLPTCSSTPRR